MPLALCRITLPVRALTRTLVLSALTSSSLRAWRTHSASAHFRGEATSQEQPQGHTSRSPETCRIAISSRVPPDFVSEKTPSVLFRLPRATKYCDGSGEAEVEEEDEDKDADEDDERGRSAAGGAACCSGTSGWLVERKRRRQRLGAANVADDELEEEAAAVEEYEQLAMGGDGDGDAAADNVRRAVALSALDRLIVIDILLLL